MYTATVKMVHPKGYYGFLTNPMPGGKDIYIEPQQGGPRLQEGQKILVLSEEEVQGKNPRAAEWTLDL